MKFYTAISDGVTALCPGVVVLRNRIPKEYVDYDLYNNLIPNTDDNFEFYDQLPRVGAFEVSYKGK